MKILNYLPRLTTMKSAVEGIKERGKASEGECINVGAISQYLKERKQ